MCGGFDAAFFQCILFYWFVGPDNQHNEPTVERTSQWNRQQDKNYVYIKWVCGTNISHFIIKWVYTHVNDALIGKDIKIDRYRQSHLDLYEISLSAFCSHSAQPAREGERDMPSYFFGIFPGGKRNKWSIQVMLNVQKIFI